jgi:Rrf2 family protein
VQVSAKTQYACIAVLELAQHFHSKEPVRIRRIADGHQIPSRFLVQILIQLRNAGIVLSTRGAAGGYRLARDPRSISLGEVMQAVEGSRDGGGTDGGGKSQVLTLLTTAWASAEEAQRKVLHATTYFQLLENLKQRTGADYTI